MLILQLLVYSVKVRFNATHCKENIIISSLFYTRALKQFVKHRKFELLQLLVAFFHSQLRVTLSNFTQL